MKIWGLSKKKLSWNYGLFKFSHLVFVVKYLRGTVIDFDQDDDDDDGCGR